MATATTTAPAKRGRPSKADIEAAVEAGNAASAKLTEQRQADAPKEKAAAKPKAAASPRMARHPEAAAPVEKQAQADKPAAAPKRAKKADAPAKQAATKPAGSGRGRKTDQQQAIGDAGTQGASASGKDTTTDKTSTGQTSSEMRGGTKQVLIEMNASVPTRMGRPPVPEDYPFGMLIEKEPSTMKGDGSIDGLSFFIPASDKPDKHIAAARKRHKGVLFWVRKGLGQVGGVGPKIEGVRVWRGKK